MRPVSPCAKGIKGSMPFPFLSLLSNSESLRIKDAEDDEKGGTWNGHTNTTSRRSPITGSNFPRRFTKRSISLGDFCNGSLFNKGRESQIWRCYLRKPTNSVCSGICTSLYQCPMHWVACPSNSLLFPPLDCLQRWLWLWNSWRRDFYDRLSPYDVKKARLSLFTSALKELGFRSTTRLVSSNGSQMSPSVVRVKAMTLSLSLR